MSTCLRCLARLSIKASRPSGPSPLIAPFSTSAADHAQSARPGAESRGRKSLKLSKRKVESKGRAPNPGERKAIRKRIVLSNTNAFEIRDLQEWNVDNYADESMTGSMVALPGPIVDSLRAIESFKPSQSWGFFRKPATLLRQETLELARHVQDPSQQTLRKIIVGDRGSGKSVLLLQAQAMAFQAGWIVFHIPEAQDLTNASTEYALLDGSVPSKYLQRSYTANLLSRIRKANQSVLAHLQLSQKHDLPFSLQENMSLDRLAENGAEDADNAWPVFQALWKELKAPGRPPILYSLDNVAHVARLSQYLTPEMYNIHAFDLAVLDNFVSHLSGSQTLPNGGMVLAADSASNRPVSAALDLAVKQSEAAVGPLKGVPLYDQASPYDDCDSRVVDVFREVGVMRMEGLDQAEAKTLLEYYAKSGALRQSVTEGLVAERLTLSGGGIVGDLERASLRAHG